MLRSELLPDEIDSDADSGSDDDSGPLTQMNFAGFCKL
jgi:hypothetical protein